ncbi:hypothetical protein ACLB2K_006809 [Fragaria x ananassa]
MALDSMVVEDSLDQTNLQPPVDDTCGKDEANSKEFIEPETSPKPEKIKKNKKRKKRVEVVVEEQQQVPKRVEVVVEEQQQVPKTTVADEEMNDERKSKVLEEMVNKWKTYKIAEVASDLAEAEFHVLFNTWALKAYNIFGYLEESPR